MGWGRKGRTKYSVLGFGRLARLFCKSYDHTTLSFSCNDEGVADQYLKLHRWQWVQRLMAERLTDIRAEVFEHFAEAPEDLKRIGWRQFEELLDSIFRNQGFRTRLSPGSNDGGVDLRLYQSDALVGCSPSIGDESKTSDRHAIAAAVEADVLAGFAVNLFEKEFQDRLIASVGKGLCFQDERLHFVIGDVVADLGFVAGAFRSSCTIRLPPQPF